MLTFSGLARKVKMKRWMTKVCIFVGLVLFYAVPVSAQEIWAGKDGNIRNVDTKAMIADEGGMYLATRTEIYRASDTGNKWESIFSVPAGENEVTCLGGRSNNILVGTRRGLYRSQDRGSHWKNVFRTITPDKNNVLAIAVSKYNPKKVLIGTARGVFISEDEADRWQDISGVLKNRQITCVAVNKDFLYVCGDDGLYFKKAKEEDWERIYVKSAQEKAEMVDSSDFVESEERDIQVISGLVLSGSRLYIGVGKKLLYSDDEGKNWNALSVSGLGGAINYILISKKGDKLYCATTKGVFEFAKDKERWVELYKGMDKVSGVSSLMFGDEEEKSLWALTEKGLYHLEGGKYLEDQYIDVERNLKSLKIVFDNEPTFQELQQAAIRFAEVSPEKIRNWRDQARLRALLPKVSFGLDNNSSTTSEIYTSATRDYIVTGPDDLNSGLDVSVSWELGDLIWSDDQTNIDVRSRLMVQLRNDILDDLRRIYYERKRIQFELMTDPPKDIKARFEKEMRLQELTQAIDDLTGNYFSKNMRQTQDLS